MQRFSVRDVRQGTIRKHVSISVVLSVEGSLGSLTCCLDSRILLGVVDGDLLELAQSGTGGDEVTADDVLLHTLEVVHLAADSRLVEDLGGLLEGGSGHEGLGTESGTGDTLQDLLGGSALGVTRLYQFLVTAAERGILVVEPACGDDLSLAEVLGVTGVGYHLAAVDTVVLLEEVELIDDVTLQEAGVTRLQDLHLTHHLAYDDLEVLVVDLHTLHAVNRLRLVDDVVLYGGRTLDSEDVVRRDGTVRERCAGADEVAFLYEDLLGQRDHVCLLLAELGGDEQLTVTALDLAVRYLAVDLRHDSGVGRITGLKELGDTRQTGGDITAAVLGAGGREERIAYLDLVTVLDLQVSLHRQVVGTEDIARLIDDMRLRQFGLVLGLGDIDLAFAGLLIGLGLAGNALDNVLEADETVLLDEERNLIGIPLADACALGVSLAGGDKQFRGVRDIEGSEYHARLLVLEREGVLTRYNEHVSGSGGDGTQIFDLDYTVAREVVGRLCRRTARQTTGVESTEGQLRTRLTDSLRRDDADRLTLLHHLTGCKVAAVTLGADAVLGLAGEYGADNHLLDTGSLDRLALRLADLLAGSDDEVTLVIMDVVYGHTS